MPRNILWKLRGVRTVAWLIWGGLLVSAFYLLTLAVTNDNTSPENSFVDVILFGVVSSVFPIVMNVLIGAEKYEDGQTQVSIAIFRSSCLRVLSLYAIMYSLFIKTDLLSNQLPLWNETVVVPVDKCAATVIGQTFTRLLWVDTLTFSLSIFTYYWFMSRVWLNKKIQVNFAEGVLSFVNRQGMIMFGMFFSPTMPLIGALSNVFIFVVYYQVVMRFCCPPTKHMATGRHNSLYLQYLLGMLVVVLIPLNFVLERYKPNCGPFGPAYYTSIFGSLRYELDSLGGTPTTPPPPHSHASNYPLASLMRVFVF